MNVDTSEASTPARRPRQFPREHREQTDRGKIGADLIDELDRGVISELAEYSRSQVADAEGDAEDDAEPGSMD
jgi:hypothetical protein